jgi:hypothetical protein
VVFACNASNDFDQFFGTEAEGPGLPERSSSDVSDARTLGGNIERLLVVADKCAAAAPAREQPLSFELCVGAIDGIRVDFEIDGHFSNGGQLVARLEPPARNRVQHLRFDLKVDGDAAGVVEMEHAACRSCPIVLVV